MPHSHVVFDISQSPPFMSATVIMTMAVMLLIGILSILNPKPATGPLRWLVRTHSPAYNIIWLSIVTMVVIFVSGAYVAKWWRLRTETNTAAAESISGCITRFHPSSGARGDNVDMVEVAGESFTYWDEETPAFHKMLRNGGPLRPDAWVRIWHVGPDITKLEVADHACPTAPLDSTWRP